jgi:hypothetical protein
MICGILATLGHGMGQHDPTNDANNPNTSQDTTKLNVEVSEKVTLFIFDICKNTNIKPMFYKHIIHLQNHGTSRCVCNIKKPNGRMTRFPLIIQEMHNENKSIYTSP